MPDADERVLANPIEAHFGPLRTFVMGNSDHPNHPALPPLQAYLRWRNAHARHPDVLPPSRERARIRSERQQRCPRNLKPHNRAVTLASH